MAHGGAGEYSPDRADSSGTLLFDLAARDWSQELLADLGLDPSWLPPSFEETGITGVVSRSAADEDRART